MGSFEGPQFGFWGPNQDRINNLMSSNSGTQKLLFRYPVQLSWQIQKNPSEGEKVYFDAQMRSEQYCDEIFEQRRKKILILILGLIFF